MKRALLIGTTIMSLVSLMASADEYRFIISGDPVVAATVDSSTAVSSGTSLVTGTLATSTAAASLEARYRTWDESDGVALRSDEFKAMVIFLR